MEYLTAEELYNFQPDERSQGGDSFSGGAAKRLFTSRGEEYGLEDEEELNNRVNTYDRQPDLSRLVNVEITRSIR